MTKVPRQPPSSARGPCISAAVVVRREIGIDEIGLVAGVVLLALGAREVWRPAGLIAPAVVLLWIYLPQRVSFIERRFIEKRRAE